jgi:hypothetical protein
MLHESIENGKIEPRREIPENIRGEKEILSETPRRVINKI